MRRATVTDIASKLQHAGYITYRRGDVNILHRAGVESVACECYTQIRSELDRALA